MDNITSFLARPFTLVMRWADWQRAAAVLALFTLLLFLLWTALGRRLRVVLGGGAKAYYLLSCELLYQLTPHGKGFARVQRRNARTERCERLYNKLRPSEKKLRGPRPGKFIVLYAAALFLVALPAIVGEHAPADYMPAVSFASNIYHAAETPLLRQSMRTEPLIRVSVSALNDVGPQDPCREGIQFVCARGLLEYSDGYFRQESALTREAMAVMLHRYFGEPNAEYRVSVSDARPGRHAYSAICWCVEQEILSLSADGAFLPDQQVTYEQFLVALCRCAQLSGLPCRAVFDLSSIPGSETMHSWAENACKWAAKNDILILNSEGAFAPRQPLSRGTAAELFFRFCSWESSYAHAP